jgi:hypothetical protein
MEKISIDDIVNTDELPLINYLECPIDNLISMTPVMCKKCETCFCLDCIETWKKKSNICPMRCNPMELMNIDKTILKQQLDKLRLSCGNYNMGCLAKLLVKEVPLHEKICEYKGIKCDKCEETIPAIGLLIHLYESCKKNVVNCFICNMSLNLGTVLSHIEKCEIGSSMCAVCIQPRAENIELHSKVCSLKLINCQICKMPELQSEINSGNHKCLMDSDLSNMNKYLKSVQSKYELSVNEIISHHDENYNDFLKKFGDINSEILKRENEKCTKLEHKLARLSDEYLKKMFILKRDKKENLNKLDHEVQELQKMIDSKNDF